MRIKVLELFFIQCIIYVVLWLTNDYVATLLSAIFFFVFLSIFAIAGIAEWLDRSNVSKLYFQMMATGFLAPLVVAVGYLLLTGSQLEWMKG